MLNRKSSAALQARYDDITNNRLPAADTSCRTAALAMEEGGNRNDWLAAKNQFDLLQAEAERLREFSIPAAKAREAEEAEAARIKTEREQAGAEAAARKASFKGAQQDLGNWRRAAAPIPELCDQLAVALAGMNKAASSYEAKIPQVSDLPPCTEYRRFTETMFRDLIAGELYRAGEAAGVVLPGAEEHAQ